MNYDPSNPLIVQGDRSILVEVEKSPEHVHTYRLTNLSLWNAAAAGMTSDAMIGVLERYSKFPLPSNLPADLRETVGRYGRVRLERAGENLKLICPDRPLLEELIRQPKVREFLGEALDETSFLVNPAFRGVLKQGLITVGYPAEDLAGYTEGALLPMHVREHMHD